MTKDEIDEFLARPLVGVITTLDAEGRPRATPIWYAWQDGAAYMFTGRDSLKWRNLERNPYASLCVDWREPPYAAVTMDGPVREVEGQLYELVLGMARRYYGEEEGREFAESYRDNPPGVVAFALTPRRVASFRS